MLLVNLRHVIDAVSYTRLKLSQMVPIHRKHPATSKIFKEIPPNQHSYAHPPPRNQLSQIPSPKYHYSQKCPVVHVIYSSVAW